MSLNLNKKEREFALLNKNFQLLSESLIRQVSLTEGLMCKGWDKDIYEEILKNEDYIDSLEVQLMEMIPNLVVLFNPRAVELRRIVSCHEVVVSLEEIGDFLIDTIEFLEKTDMNSPDYEEIKLTLTKMFIATKEIISDAAFSFLYEDKIAAYRTIAKDKAIESLSCEIKKNSMATFQNRELKGQEVANVINVNCISYIIERIKDTAIDIAKSAVFVTEGTNIRHKKIENN